MPGKHFTRNSYPCIGSVHSVLESLQTVDSEFTEPVDSGRIGEKRAGARVLEGLRKLLEGS